MKKHVLSILVLLAAVATGAMAQNYTITLPSVSNGSVVAKVSDVSVTSAAAGATVTLEATPDAGYKLKTISGTYQGPPEETLSGSNHPATLSGTYFTLNSTSRVNARWNLYNSTITITSKNDGIKIDRVVFNLNYKGNSFDASLLSADKGTLSVSGNTLTVTSINSSSVTITSTANTAKGCGTDQVTIYGTGTVDKTLTLTSTGDDNVKTFTMPSGNVTVSAAFERVNVSGVSLSQTEAAMTLGGETLTLTATVAPDDTADKTVTWTTSDETVATVTDGVVTAVAVGTATITVTATNGTADTSDDKSATCTVTVSPAGYSVAQKEGTDDADKWQGKAGEGEYQALPLTGLEAGTAVTVKYNGTKKVKSVKAKKKQ